MTELEVRGNPKADEDIVNERIEDVGWALLFLVSGAILLIPGVPHPWGAWLLGVGTILVGLNAARYALGIRVHVFIAGLGVIAILAGAAEYAGVDLPILALCLLLVGAVILLKPLAERSSVTA